MTSLFTTEQIFELHDERHRIHKQRMAERLEPFVNDAVKFYAQQMRPASHRILHALKYSDWAYAFEFNSYDFRDIPGRGHALGDWPRAGTVLKRLDYDDYYNTSHYEIIHKRDPCGTLFYIDGRVESMWSIWAWTDFRKRLLTELCLDPEQFEFKNISSYTLGNNRMFRNDKIPEFVNTVYLVFKKPTDNKA